MSTYNVKMEGSEQEWQLLQVLRNHGADVASDFRLLVQRQDSAWDVTLSIAPHDELNTSRGTGSTFNDAWDNMALLWTLALQKERSRLSKVRADVVWPGA
jgi:hypothetical protein